jgi:uncharacterized protein
MIKVVLDTNVLISGLLSPAGKLSLIHRLIFDKKIALFISDSILDETIRVLGYPRIVKLMKKNNLTLEKTRNALGKLKKIATQTPDKIKIDVIKNDPSDNIILECALEGRVDYIISGDSHLKDLEIFQNIKIVNPSDFLDLINIEEVRL